MSPQEELLDLLARLVGAVSAEDLVEDAQLAAMIGQLIQTLAPKAAPIPVDILKKLSSIDNRIERFKTAASLLEATDPEKLKQVADSLRQAGLLKTDNPDLNRAEKADLVTFPPAVKDGAKCSNCKYVDAQNSYCNHPDVVQRLKDGIDRMCCSYWDSPGTKREWDDGKH